MQRAAYTNITLNCMHNGQHTPTPQRIAKDHEERSICLLLPVELYQSMQCGLLLSVRPFPLRTEP